MRSSGGLTINSSTQYPARFFYANYETFDFVFHFAYLVGIKTPLLIKHGVLLFSISCERGPAFAFPFWQSNFRPQAVLGFPTLRGIPEGLPMAWCASNLIVHYWFLSHLHVADGISGEIKRLMNHPSCDTVHSNSFAAS